jgi:hypothetical protein
MVPGLLVAAGPAMPAPGAGRGVAKGLVLVGDSGRWAACISALMNPAAKFKFEALEAERGKPLPARHLMRGHMHT